MLSHQKMNHSIFISKGSPMLKSSLFGTCHYILWMEAPYAGEGLCPLAWMPTFPTRRLFLFFFFFFAWLLIPSAMPSPSLFEVCICFCKSWQPSTSLSPCRWWKSQGTPTSVSPQARGQRQNLRLPDHTAPFLLAQETWFRFGVPVFTQMVAWVQWKIRWIWNLKPVNLTTSAVKL